MCVLCTYRPAVEINTAKIKYTAKSDEKENGLRNRVKIILVFILYPYICFEIFLPNYTFTSRLLPSLSGWKRWKHTDVLWPVLWHVCFHVCQSTTWLAHMIAQVPLYDSLWLEVHAYCRTFPLGASDWLTLLVFSKVVSLLHWSHESICLGIKWKDKLLFNF